MSQMQIATIDREAACAAEQNARATAGPLARKFIAYSDALCALVKAAKDPGFDPATAWTRIESYFDLPDFVRYGAFREVTGWEEYRGMLAAHSNWGDRGPKGEEDQRMWDMMPSSSSRLL